MENDASPLFGSERRTVGLGTDGVWTSVLEKYGEAAVGGFQAVPDLLFKKQVALGLSVTDLTVLLNVLMHWWYADQKPFPRASTIATRMGVSPRTVQRSLAHMSDKLGLLKREMTSDGKAILDPTPLVKRLEELAPTDSDYLVRRHRRRDVAQRTEP